MTYVVRTRSCPSFRHVFRRKKTCTQLDRLAYRNNFREQGQSLYCLLQYLHNRHPLRNGDEYGKVTGKKLFSATLNRRLLSLELE